ncbi:hypothetical protein [Gordonia alkanivorans]|uniref:hypothetical protein n=1 Tax=Gordonia alkanivorans TaxID=84096 RepID=UPI000693CF1F|nr:hypothetical protein [Gordonia alkanivorans]
MSGALGPAAVVLRIAQLPVTMVITPPPPLTVRIDAFEYGCCRTPPAVGETVNGTLSAYPTLVDRSPVQVTSWDRDRGLIAFDGGVAQRKPSDANPLDQPVGLWLSWHSGEMPGVEATGTVTSVSQIYLGSATDPTAGEILQPVERVERFPEALLTPAGAFEPSGAVVTLTDLVLVEPTPQQIADYRAEQAIAQRTIHITAPRGISVPQFPTVGNGSPSTSTTPRRSTALPVMAGQQHEGSPARTS